LLSLLIVTLPAGTPRSALAQTEMGPTTADTAAPLATTKDAPTACLAASETRLWVSVSADAHTRLYTHTRTGTFAAGTAVNGRIVAMIAADDDLFVYFDDNAFYRFATERPQREIDLPERVRPISAAGKRGLLYALVPARCGAELASAATPETAPVARAIDPAEASLCVVAYDGLRWRPVAACPRAVNAPRDTALGPRILAFEDALLLFWVEVREGRVQYARLDLETARWQPGGVLGIPRLRRYWVTEVNRLPTLLAVVAADAESEKLLAFRLGPEAHDASGERWFPADLQLAVPDGVAELSFVDAAGFNQHVALLAHDAAGAPQLCFGRFGAEPLEAATSITALTRPPPLSVRRNPIFHVAALLVVVLVFAGLFVFRRGSMVRSLELPAGWTLAYTLQRLGGAAIDLIPFTVVGARLVGLPWLSAARELASWAIRSDQVSGGLSEQSILLWWGFSALTYGTYCLVMELLVRRTAGKALMGTHLLSETGQPLTRTQLLIRNAFRYLELLPPLWVLSFLVVLTRNRQRLGDIFARTIVVRRAPVQPPADDEPHQNDEPPKTE